MTSVKQILNNFSVRTIKGWCEKWQSLLRLPLFAPAPLGYIYILAINLKIGLPFAENFSSYSVMMLPSFIEGS